MPAQYLFRQLRADGGEHDRLVVVLRRVAIGHQATDGFGNRGTRHPELVGQARADHRVAFHRHVVNGFEIFFSDR